MASTLSSAGTLPIFHHSGDSNRSTSSSEMMDVAVEGMRPSAGNLKAWRARFARGR